MSTESKKMENKIKRHKVGIPQIILLILLIVGTLYIANENNKGVTTSRNTNAWKQDNIQKNQGGIFGTIYNITYDSSVNLDDSIKQVLTDVDNSLSPFNPESNISAINKNTTDVPDSRMLQVFNLSKEISQKTDGAFDITVAPLVNLWGFGFENMDEQNIQMVDSILEFVGIDKINLIDGKLVKTDARVQLDCSAIAKGYGVDAVGLYLESKGVKNYMVEIGGEIRTKGYNPNGARWKIGVNTPDDDIEKSCEIAQVIELTDISVATSGNYRNYYIKDNKKYAHTIDPRTGHPIQHNILSSTVLAKDCSVADAYATSFMVMGLEKSKLVLEQNPDIKAYFIYSIDSVKSAVWYSPSLKEMIK